MSTSSPPASPPRNPQHSKENSKTDETRRILEAIAGQNNIQKKIASRIQVAWIPQCKQHKDNIQKKIARCRYNSFRSKTIESAWQHSKENSKIAHTRCGMGWLGYNNIQKKIASSIHENLDFPVDFTQHSKENSKVCLCKEVKWCDHSIYTTFKRK